MEDYLNLKRYNTRFGDLVPLIIANGLGINMIILGSHQSKTPDIVYGKRHGNSGLKDHVFIYKSGEHYDAIIPTNPGFVKNNDPFVSSSDTDNSVFSDIKFLVWNINGLSDFKLCDDVAGNLMRNFDIILLCETWAGIEDEFVLDGYRYFNYPRRFRHKNAKRNSGGLGIFIRESIAGGVSGVKSNQDLMAWLKLDKDFFKLRNDIYLANIYIPPEGSVYMYEDVYHLIQNDILSFPADTKILAVGDYNARTNMKLDFISSPGGCDGELASLLPIDDNDSDKCIQYLNSKQSLHRYSMDSAPMNSHGRCLLEFCQTSGLLIANGRVGNDRGVGKYTTGSSVVDYVICSPSLMLDFSTFEVLNKLPESDHIPISFALKCHLPARRSIKIDSDEWGIQYKYKWLKDDLPKICDCLTDEIGCADRACLKDHIVSMNCTNDVVSAFNKMMSHAFEILIPVLPVKNKRECKASGPKWFDRELKDKRIAAIKAGEHVVCEVDKQQHRNACKDYRSHRQRKKRKYQRYCVKELDDALTNGNHNMWKLLKNMCPRIAAKNNEPADQEFFEHFNNLASPITAEYFDYDYEKSAAEFIKKYDDNSSPPIYNKLEYDCLNSNFTKLEIEAAIDYLKYDKAPGADYVPAEFIKSCKSVIADDITDVFNYIIEKKEFPDLWTEGIRSAVHKGGTEKLVDNYRGITILPIMEKGFEISVYRRLSFLNEAFDKYDKFNGGYMKDTRTTDNLFILNGLIQSQLTLGKSLFVCFVDFSKAFDLVNRSILFYKLLKLGWGGRVIDTLRNLYSKTKFRVKRNGMLSSPILNEIGVNQGGICSGILFRKYMSDLSQYLTSELGVCIGENVIGHLLWADDLILFSDSITGLQRQLNGLMQFCSFNQMIVNESKTKAIQFGKKNNMELFFNKKKISEVHEYKYLGNVIKSTQFTNEDAFQNNYQYLCDKARKAIFSSQRMTKSLNPLSPKLKFHIFDTLIRPVLTYGSDVWGHRKSGLKEIDRVFMRYVRCVLSVKATTSNVIVIGECGRYPPSVCCHISLLCFFNRMYHMSDTKLSKQVYSELLKLHENGFPNWISNVTELSKLYEIDIFGPRHKFNQQCKRAVTEHYIEEWRTSLNDV